jgi:pyruvate dehydrogenase E2 component (dihydrolipoamide acetyltransferase)
MTDKATVTITAPKAGKIASLGGKVGQVVAVHSVLVVFDLGGTAPIPSADTPSASAPSASAPSASAPSEAAPAAKKDDGPAATAVGDIREDLPGMSHFAAAPSATPSPSAAPAASPSYFNEKPLATPATRKLARDLGVDLRRPVRRAA